MLRRYLAAFGPASLRDAADWAGVPTAALLVSTKTPQSRPSFLLDGQVAGRWRFDRDRIRTDPFEPIPASARREVDAEARRLLDLHR